MTNRFSKLIQDFLTTYIIGECNYSVNTRVSYSTTFHLLLEFIDNEKNIKPNKIEIETSRLAVIPKNDAEVLAYEFTGKYNDETYYVYISAKTGKEIVIFKVVKTTEGNLIV